MNRELELFDQRVQAAQTPEELFGTLKGDADAKLKSAKAHFRKFARIAHTDHYRLPEDQLLANRAFSKLASLWKWCQERIADGTYGTTTSYATKNKPVTVRVAGGHTYVIETGLASGDVSNVYLGEGSKAVGKLLFKISASPQFNDILKIESEVLKKLNVKTKDTKAYDKFIPHLVDVLSLQHEPTKTRRTVNVMQYVEGHVSLIDIFAQYPGGIDQRHFVWIWRRILCMLDFIHSAGIVHGAVLPEHMFVHPIHHGMYAIDWCFSRPIGHHMQFIPNKRENWYPPEVLAKRQVTPALDIYMAAQCMAYLLGVDPGESFAGKDIHPKFRRMLEACLIHNPARRVAGAWKLYREFSEAATEVYGPKRRYVKLEMA